MAINGLTLNNNYASRVLNQNSNIYLCTYVNHLLTTQHVYNFQNLKNVQCLYYVGPNKHGASMGKLIVIKSK